MTDKTHLANEIIDYGKPVQGECTLHGHVCGLEMGIALKH